MAERLKNTLQFANLAPGASIALPHGLHTSVGRPLAPDIIHTPNPGLAVVSDKTNVTLTNTGSLTLSGSILVEAWHTIERAFNDANDEDLPIKPYIVVSAQTPSLSDTLTALGFFNADGTFVKQCGFVPGSAQHLGTGVYQVQLAAPPPNMFTDICFAVTRGGTTDGSEVATVVAPDIVQVRTFDAAGAAADSLFCLKVWDMTKC